MRWNNICPQSIAAGHRDLNSQHLTTLFIPAGRFLFVDGNPSNLQKRAYLKSSLFHRSKGKSCRFHFYYMIEKDNSLRLLLYSDEVRLH